MNSKGRIVKCPKCRSVLPEPPNVAVYECGGCGTKLQAKKRNNSAVDTTSQRLDNDSSGKRKVDRVIDDQEAGSSQQLVLRSTDESYQNSDHNDLHSSNKDQDAANRAENGTGEAGSSSNQQFVLHSTDASDQNSDLNNLHSLNKDQDAANRVENGTVKAPTSGVEEHSSQNLKMKQLSDDQEPCCSSNQQSPVNSTDEPDQNIHNDPRSSTDFSGHEDPDSSPEATAHNSIDQEQEQKQKQDQNNHQENVAAVGKQKIKQLSDDNETDSSMTQLLVNSTNELDQNNDQNEQHTSSEVSYHDDPESSPETTDHNRVKRHETEFVSCRNDTEIEETSSEFEANTNTRNITDSDGGSKSSFRTTVAEKLLNTRQKQPLYLDEEDDILSENGSSDLHHYYRRRFNRISSVESMETTRYNNTNHYAYEGSVSSFDGNDLHQNPRKHHTGSIRDEHSDSGNSYRFNRRNAEHRSTDVRSFYGLNEFDENPRYRSSMIPENPKMERIELLKLVRELQNQLERTNVSNVQRVSSYSYGRRTTFSGEATAVNRQRYGGSCQHFSAQIGPSYGPGYGPSSYNSPRFSSPSSPRQNQSVSDFSVYDDQMQRNDVRKTYCSPKKKKYVRPIAGGSPWITCYLCCKLLQLPQSFLMFNKRRYCSLRCGACFKVLNFTLSNGTHVSRYDPGERIVAPPSSEVEDFEKLTESWGRAETVSCSDRSFGKSYSTETDRNGSREFSEERRKEMVSRDPSGSTRPPLSSKVSGRRTTMSEIEEVEHGHNGSPLHWLMGYASPSKVIRGL
ncbi:hypothetical protein QVD17_35789 [Tagetes erecta]|uniref:Zinc-ribbon domain-containing protein n=1 Tax=Tagetes erecta TaxID=13708 RepID=A0AAD8NII6_TARER|nr:hypothetical protein QVD17_35789 [Tagetes erecta]